MAFGCGKYGCCGWGNRRAALPDVRNPVVAVGGDRAVGVLLVGTLPIPFCSCVCGGWHDWPVARRSGSTAIAAV